MSVQIRPQVHLEGIMYVCICGREFEKKQSYVAHCGHCKIKRASVGEVPTDRFVSNPGHRGKGFPFNDPNFVKLHREQGSTIMLKLWKSEEFRKRKSKDMSDNHRNPNFMYAKLKSMGVLVDGPGLVYLVEFKDTVKVGFSTNLSARLKYLKNPTVLKTKEFKYAYEAITLECYIHEKYKEFSIRDGSKDSTEIYPIKFKEDLLKELS